VPLRRGFKLKKIMILDSRLKVRHIAERERTSRYHVGEHIKDLGSHNLLINARLRCICDLVVWFSYLGLLHLVLRTRGRSGIRSLTPQSTKAPATSHSDKNNTTSQVKRGYLTQVNDLSQESFSSAAAFSDIRLPLSTSPK